MEGKIYALYSGKSKDDKVHYSYSDCLYVFSMDGKCLSKYILDCPICDFVVDINKKKNLWNFFECRNCLFLIF